MRKKDQYKDLSATDLEEEIKTLVTTGLLFKNDKNSLFIRNLANTPTKDQENQFGSFDQNTDDEASENQFGSFDQNTDDEASENENSSTSTEENINDSPKIAFRF